MNYFNIPSLFGNKNTNTNLINALNKEEDIGLNSQNDIEIINNSNKSDNDNDNINTLNKNKSDLAKLIQE